MSSHKKCDSGEKKCPGKAIGAAVVAGVAAAGVVYLLYTRPQWRQHIITAGKYLLNAVEGIVKHGGELK